MSVEQDLPNFVKVFRSKMGSIKPLSKQESADVAYKLKGSGITQVKKRAPVIIFELEPVDFEPGNLMDFTLHLWVEDLHNIIDLRLVHEEMRTKLRKIINYQHPSYRLANDSKSGYAIEDNQGNIYLAVAFDQAEMIQSQLRESFATTGDMTKSSGERWVSLIKRYNLPRIIGDVKKYSYPYCENNYPDFYDWTTGTIADLDLVGKWREEGFLYMYAKDYQMTNFQFMRFRSFILAANKAQISIVYDQIAREIVGMGQALEASNLG